MDPLTRGVSAAVYHTGALTGETGNAISEPVGNVHFVGTETSPGWRGYLDRALQSAIRDGKEVILALG